MHAFRLTVLLASLCSLAWAQGFQPLQSGSPIPEGILQPTFSQLSEEDASPFSDEARRELTEDDFVLGASDNYSLLAELKNSGKILFNEPVSNYLNRVATQALHKENELRNILKFYVVKSAAVNAFTSLEGEVFFTLGYIAKVETEAELAYAICREAANYELKHSWDNYRDKLRLGTNQNEFVKPGLEERLFNRSMYTEDQAASADMFGFDIYKETGYHMFAPNYVFDYLLYAAYPFENMYFQHSLLETKHMQFPKPYLLPKTKGLIPEELFDNSRSIHPNIQSRRNAVNQEAGPIFDQGKTWFKLAMKDFEEARKLARYEICRLYLLQRKYPEALYTAYMLQFYDPYNLYLKKITAKALYGITAYANANRKYMALQDWNEVDGHWQQLHHLLAQMTPGEITGFALVNSWQTLQAHPEDIELQALVRELMREFTTHHFLSLSELHDEPAAPQQKTDEPTTADEGTTIGGVTYRTGKTGKDSFIRYAFVDIKKSPQFVELFEYYRKSSGWVEIRLSEEAGYDPKDKRNRKKRDKESTPAPIPLNINALVLNQPDYYSMDRTDPDADIRLDTDLQGQSVIGRIIEGAAENSDMSVRVLAPTMFGKDMVSSYNDMAFLNEWLQERSLHRDVEMLSMDMQQAKDFTRKYGTPYVGHMSVTRTVARRQNKGAVLAATIIALPALPFGIIYSTTNDYKTAFLTRVYDMNDGGRIYDNYHVRKSKDSENTLQKAVRRELQAIQRLEE